MSSDPRATPLRRRLSAPPELARSSTSRGLLRLRGGPLIDALDDHLPGAREHAEATASYAFAGAVGLGFDRAQSEVAREVAVPARGRARLRRRRARREARRRSQLPRRPDAWDEHYEAGYRLVRGAGIPERVCGWLLRAARALSTAAAPSS